MAHSHRPALPVAVSWLIFAVACGVHSIRRLAAYFWELTRIECHRVSPLLVLPVCTHTFTPGSREHTADDTSRLVTCHILYRLLPSACCLYYMNVVHAQKKQQRLDLILQDCASPLKIATGINNQSQKHAFEKVFQSRLVPLPSISPSHVQPNT